MTQNQNGDRSPETDLGLYIGRFQPFHKGHEKVVNTMLRENKVCVILIGLSEDPEKNPYSYWQRLHFFTHSYANEEHLRIYPLPDEDTDQKWIESILSIPEVQQAENITLYCGDKKNDSAINVIETYKNMFPHEISLREISRKEIPLTATQIRKNIREKGLESEKNNIPGEVYDYLKGA